MPINVFTVGTAGGFAACTVILGCNAVVEWAIDERLPGATAGARRASFLARSRLARFLEEVLRIGRPVAFRALGLDCYALVSVYLS